MRPLADFLSEDENKAVLAFLYKHIPLIEKYADEYQLSAYECRTEAILLSPLFLALFDHVSKHRDALHSRFQDEDVALLLDRAFSRELTSLLEEHAFVLDFEQRMPPAVERKIKEDIVPQLVRDDSDAASWLLKNKKNLMRAASELYKKTPQGQAVYARPLAAADQGLGQKRPSPGSVLALEHEAGAAELLQEHGLFTATDSSDAKRARETVDERLTVDVVSSSKGN